MSKVLNLGLEAFSTLMALQHLFVRNQQYQSEDIAFLTDCFETLDSTLLSDPNLAMVAEAEEAFTFSKQRRYRLTRNLRKMYKKSLKLMMRLKRLNKYSDLGDGLLNIIEKGYM